MSSININEKANLIWSIADKITGVYKPHEYGEIILPLTVLRRFDCVLESTKNDVLKEYEKMGSSKNIQSLEDKKLKKVSGYDFYNVSKFTFSKLLDDPDNIEVNFQNYLNGFSENTREIIEKFKFDPHIVRLSEKGLLYIVLKEFTSTKADMHPDKISNVDMGYIFEEIIRRFSESHNEQAGQHYTPREVIELMVNILFIDTVSLSSSTPKTIYDPACGTGGMLSVAEEYLKKMNNSMKLLGFGQELNDQTYAICKADMLIKGDNASENIKSGNTISNDQFKGMEFDYILCNPPFGREWKVEKSVVDQEAKVGLAGRFGYGLPSIVDSQMLFLLIAIFKMKKNTKEGTRIAIIHNGSPLFVGDAGSGPSEIRRYILENDLLEAIIALPNDIFYNTGITTYIWVLANKKSSKRKGKVQLVDASEMYEKRRKSLGGKRNNISKYYIDEVTKIYGNFSESEVSKIFNNEDFGYSKITIERPLLDDTENPIIKNKKMQPDASKRDTENVPLTENIQTYFNREVLPFVPDAWIDESKTKIGYEIPFTRYFYKYESPVPSNKLMKEIKKLEKELLGSLDDLFQN
jgi:Type I restriction-modification system methyltransferase subunit